LVVGTLYFLIPYNVLMYGVNDVFDHESDLQNPRKGGIEGSLLDRKFHALTIRTSIVLNLPFILYLLSVGAVAANAVLLFVVFMVVAYSVKGLRFKEIPFLDSATSSTHFTGPLVYALFLIGWQPTFWPFVIAFFFWGMASHAFGAVQDIIPDREGGIDSIATIWGARKTVWLALALYGIAAILLSMQPWPIPLVALCVLLYAVILIPFLRLSDQKSSQANNGWKKFLWLNMFTGFVITMLIILYLK
jgi:4-hydroxybenzoate polyprenyltransferase